MNEWDSILKLTLSEVWDNKICAHLIRKTDWRGYKFHKVTFSRIEIKPMYKIEVIKFFWLGAVQVVPDSEAIHLYTETFIRSVSHT